MSGKRLKLYLRVNVDHFNIEHFNDKHFTVHLLNFEVFQTDLTQNVCLLLKSNRVQLRTPMHSAIVFIEFVLELGKYFLK